MPDTATRSAEPTPPSRRFGQKRSVFVAAVVVGVSALVIPSAFPTPGLSGPGVIRITDTELARKRVDVAPNGPTIGDLVFTRSRLFNKRLTPKSIGHADSLCTYTGAGSSSCSATFSLPRGKVMTTGVITSRLFYELAVTGGTGLYDNAKGTLTVTALGGRPLRHLLLFRLTV